MMTLNSTWYRAPSLTYPPFDYAKAQEIAARYENWYEEKHGKSYEYQAPPQSDMARSPILKSLKTIGMKEGMAVTIRSTSPAMGECQESGDTVKLKTVSAPQLYVVSHGGNRLDSFLKLANAKAFAERYLVRP